ncbi:RNA-binding protein 28 [Daktulosphaira vitifoliae]|uniref:RNA-binding protein 28 n=1 Tax=Daktulosphaira vitifoliae TaxID=58002 RepID=UPI0021AAEBA2|nr:RNA-binding protein 28 [Daktulosphaira vitifoliae]XP_050520883.1 RNA-binding protein 28 [Daktulosphaira vitifoliae]
MKKKVPFIQNGKKVNNRRGRLIIRNLPFTVNEEQIQEYFSKFGEINDIKLLRKSDGKLIGCGFVQFVVKQNAAKAIANTSGKDFCGRSIVVDWAIPKNKYETIHAPKEENIEYVKEEKEIKEEIMSDYENEEIKDKVKTSKTIDDYLSLDTSNDIKEEQLIDFEKSNLENDINLKRKTDDNNISNENKKHFKSHDAKEGLTVFLKNVSFSVKNEDLKRFMREKFGSVYYALICVDKLTEHSKGTAFVKFRDTTSVDACMTASPENLTLCGSLMEPQIAVDKEILDKSKQEKFTHKDNRNLYLIKEGVIVAGTAAANGVSISDMNKRLELEQWKSQVLKNLNMFVARNRLIVHNLPASMDNKKLKELFIKYTHSKAVSKAVVMKNLKKIDPKGIPVSKEYGFVTFKEHEDALKALRAINNNPNIFHPNKRPIVAFSIENRLVLQARQRRIDKSKICNPLNKNYKNENIKITSNKNENNKHTSIKNRKQNDLPNYTGITAKPGHTSIRPKFKLKIQSEAHEKNVKTKKKLSLKKKRELSLRNEKKREPKMKSKKKNSAKNDISFSKLVNKYKSKINVPETMKKWYEN